MNIEEMKSRIIKLNKLYREGNPIISDEEYDSLLFKLEYLMLKEEFLEFRQSLMEPKGDVSFNYIIGSLNKIKYEEPDELYKWIKKQNVKTIFASEKIDGCSFIASYRNGNFISCSSRGDGSEGTDWTEKARLILSQKIEHSLDLDIRGEFTLEKDTFEKLGFKNKRNGTVGIMNSKEIHDGTNLVQAYCYEIMNMDFGIKQQFEYLKKCGFRTPDIIEFNITTLSDIPDILKAFYDLNKINSPYDIDGVVISDINYKRENKLLPDGKVAFKINSEGIETEVLDIEWEVSRTRYLKPVLTLKPIDIDGSTVQRATAYNAKYILENGIGKGSIVSVIKAGCVIPKIINVIKKVEYQFPLECPECQAPVEWNGVELQCVNELCGEIKRVEHFIRNLEIENVSIKRLKEWGINTFKDLISFRPDEKYKSQLSFYRELLEKVFYNTPEKLMRAFHCNGISGTNFDKLLNHYGSLNKLDQLFYTCENSPVNFDENDLPFGVGYLTIEKGINDWNVNIELLDLIISDLRYEEKYVKDDEDIEENVLVKSDILNGKTFLFTGTMLLGNRKDMESMVKNLGGSIAGSVNSKLDYLVAGNDKIGKSSKWKKATEIGVKIITEEEFLKMVN